MATRHDVQLNSQPDAMTELNDLTATQRERLKQLDARQTALKRKIRKASKVLTSMEAARSQIIRRQVDSATKAYLNLPHIFADFFNGVVFQGKPVVNPDELQTVENEYVTLLATDESSDVFIKRIRDLCKLCAIKTDSKAAYCFLAVEEQTKLDDWMALRVMLLDALTYDTQSRTLRLASLPDERNEAGFEPRLLPVITIVFYANHHRWSGPRCLHDLMPNLSPELKTFIPNYPLNLLEPATMTNEKLNCFQTSLKLALEGIQQMQNMPGYVTWFDQNQSEKRFDTVENECVAVLNELSGYHNAIDRKGETTMTALEEYGIEREKCGEARRAYADAKRMLADGMACDLVAKYADLPLDEVKALAEQPN